MNSRVLWAHAAWLVAIFCVAVSQGCRSAQPSATSNYFAHTPDVAPRNEGLQPQPTTQTELLSGAPSVTFVDDPVSIGDAHQQLVTSNNASDLLPAVAESAEAAPSDVSRPSTANVSLPAISKWEPPMPEPVTLVEQPATPEGPSPNATIELHIENVRPQRGAIKVAIFTEADTFLNPHAASQSFELGDESASAKMTLATNKPCAIAVFQDIDGNGQMTKNRAGLPVEPYGFSNNVTIKRGPPKFSDALVVADPKSIAPTQVRIQLTDSPLAPRK